MLFADVGETATVGAISAVIGAIGGSLLKPTFDFFLKRQEVDSAGDAKRRRMEINDEKDHVNRLETRIKVLEDREIVWMNKERECQERVAELSEELGNVKGKLISLERLVERVEGSQHVAMVVCDDQGIITSWNPAATFFFHWTQQEAIGQHVSMLIPPKLKGRHAKAFHAAVQVKELVDSKREVYALTREGIEVPVAIALTSYEDGDRRFFAAEIRKIPRG